MIVSKIPGLGRFGIFIDDLDLNNITEEEWLEVGKLHLESLVTIIRGNDIDYHRYYELISKWGTPRYNRPIQFYLKYGKSVKDIVLNREFDPEDLQVFRNGRRWQMDKRYPSMIRVTAKKNNKGESLGIFGDGELKWHSNECGDTAFTPGVALMGWENMQDTSTGFCTTADWYESQSESFRSELDDMILIHNFHGERIGDAHQVDQDNFYKNNGCPDDNNPIPLVIESPGGIKGIHLGMVSYDRIDGMSKKDSDDLFDKLQREIITEKYIYRHQWKSDKDILLFDNSITVHNRELDKPNAPERLGLRIQFDYDNVTGKKYKPYLQEEYNTKREFRIDLLNKALA